MFGWFKRRKKVPEISPLDKVKLRYLEYLTQRMHVMATDLAKLQASVDRNSKAVAALVASHDDPAVQKAVDDAAAALDVSSASAEAAVAPAA